MVKKRRINQVYDPVLSVHTDATNYDRLVYLLVANRPIRYGKDFSRIIYIGTTRKGIRRIASSASYRIAQAMDDIRGIKRVDAYVVWSRSKKGKHTHHGMTFWQILERALILGFKERYGMPPKLNGTGQRMKTRNEFDVFREYGIKKIISRYT